MRTLQHVAVSSPRYKKKSVVFVIEFINITDVTN